jgi:hypothetical protein
VSVEDAFDQYQRTVDADATQVKTARDRRATFKGALGAEADVVEVKGSGALARSTQLKPIHDVDLIVVYDAAEHPDWGQPGPSSQAALDHAGSQVNALLGATNGTYAQLVRLALPRNHAVKCFIDPPGQDDAFTVDVMPVLRQSDGTLLIPGRLDEEWITADPEYLIELVAKLQAEWAHFRSMIRVLKQWRLLITVEGTIKSLVMEILALSCLPRSGSRPEALRAFFTAAAVVVNEPIEDPAGHCGLIQPDLDVAGLRAALENAADLATDACAATDRKDTDEAQRLWQRIFGPDFPAPAKKLSPAITAPAFITTPRIKDAPQG